MSQNLPILYRNILDGLDTEDGKRAFLWATEQTSEDRFLYKAEAFAHEVERVAAVIWSLIGMGSAQHNLTVAQHIDLYVFTMRRHAHMRFPGKNDAWI